MTHTFFQKLSQPNTPLLLYELLPPVSSDIEYIYEYAHCAINFLKSSRVSLNGINIPEVRDEDNGTKRTEKYISKVEPRQLATILREIQSESPLEIIINRCTVYESFDFQKIWLEETIKKIGLSNLILVGGSSGKIQYPGPTVIEMAQYIKNKFNLFSGGITIPHRRNTILTQDEPYRMVVKSSHGIDFFTTQILYDSFHIKKLLKDYDTLCKQKNILPKRIFLSFAPISLLKDLVFLRWLGVQVSPEIENTLFKTEIGTGWRSLNVTLNILIEILDFIDQEKISVPIGLNIEHITRHNFELSKEFIEILGSTYNDYIFSRINSGINLT